MAEVKYKDSNGKWVSVPQAVAVRTVDAATSTEVLSTDGSNAMKGNLNMNGNRIVGLASPAAADEAVTKSYVDIFTPMGAANLTAPSDLLNIDLNGNYGLQNMQDSIIRTESALTLTNSPVTSGAFYGYRKVKRINHQTMIIIEESYPMMGRIWTRVYDPNYGTWLPKTGWAETKPLRSYPEGNIGLSAADVGAVPAGLLNPPLNAGVEYATGYMWGGAHTVYTKCVYIGNLPNTSATLFAHGAAVSRILFVTGTTTSGLSMPNSDVVELYADTQNIVVRTVSNVSSQAAWVTIYYTKT